MKQFFFLLIACSFLKISDAQWVPINSGTVNGLHDVHFPSSSTGYAVGYYGTILKSTDAGNTWQSVSSPKNTDWHTVCFLNENTGFIGGDSSYIFRTADGGNSWTAITIAGQGIFRSIYFSDGLNGFAGGGTFGVPVILRTTDGGLNWNSATIDSLADRPITSIHFPTADTGYATMLGYSDNFLKTVDGGSTWALMPIQLPNFLSNLESVFFTDALTGYIGGWYNPVLIKTTDGGSTWQFLDSLSNPQLYSVFFTDENTGYAAGWYGTLNKTTDAGNSWQAESGVSTQQILYSVFFTAEGTGFAVGDSGYIFKKFGTVGISETKINEEEMRIYPNPNNGKFELFFPDSYRDGNRYSVAGINIYNMLGEMIFQKPITVYRSPIIIDLGKHGSGMYYVKMVSEAGVIVKKVVVE